MEDDDDVLPFVSSIQSQRVVKRYFTESYVHTQESMYTWKIKNFSHYFFREADAIKSSIFKTQISDHESLSWLLSFYPCGNQAGYEDHAVLSIDQIEQETYPEEIPTLYFKCSIQYEDNGYLREEVRYENRMLFDNIVETESHFIPDFIRRSEMDRYLQNGYLTIRCRVYVLADITQVETVQTPPIDHQSTMDHRIQELRDFCQLYKNEKFSDVELIVGEVKLPAHKCVLSVRSPVFFSMFEHDMKEQNENKVTITDIRSTVMTEVLRFIYTAKVNKIDTIAAEILAAADKYQLTGLKKMCEEYLSTQLSVENACEILLVADQTNTEKLYNTTLDFITIHANEIVTSEKFDTTIKTYTYDLLLVLLKNLMLKM
ncbi:speckle-type POZ protein-like [Phymastichus coffea]|uniref:speckle-type POZ protein-like n=1 Tax=Phymastichus coffea TaxID=108790 RepID=UPI00273B1B24|nr:speckle-type POZ protein-like [Phymastichus coffea]